MSSSMAIPKNRANSRGYSRNWLGFTTVLPRSCFREQLRVEKLRADRSKSALSIILLSLKKNEIGEYCYVDQVFELIQARIRGTDIVGFVDKGVIGIIFPDTDRKGIHQILENIADGKPRLFSSIIGGTYPDEIFDKITEEAEGRADVFSIILEDSIERSRFKLALKRGIDIVGSIIGIMLFSPIMLLIVIAIKATSPGPVIFKQTRLGRKGTPFTFYKFRSMHLNTDDRIHREYTASLIKGEHNRINQGDVEKPLYKIKSDSRTTKIGRIIRKTSMDELPQFFNVLKGDMSLVGPRPCISYEAENYEAWHLRRILEVKPGITGLWQVEGRSKTGFDDMVRLDIQYIQNWSIMLDLKILIKTFKVVLECGGAC